MDRGLVERLTPRQRDCLRALAIHGSRSAAAHALSIPENTLKTHLTAARKALGAASSASAAALLAQVEGIHPSWASPRRAISTTEFSYDESATVNHSSIGQTGSGVREDRATFEYPPPETSIGDRIWERAHDLNRLSRSALIVLIMACMIVMLGLMFWFTDGLQKWADVITAYRHHH